MEDAEQHKGPALIAYILYAIGIVMPLLSFVAVIINHVKRGDARGTWVESHHRWMMRTFWFGLLFGVIGAVLMIVPMVGWLVLIAVSLWYIYRVVRGLLNYSSARPMYENQAPIEEKLSSENAGA